MITDKPKASKDGQRMSEFGRTLYSMMVAKGMERRQDLVSALNDNGYAITQSRLSYYLNGERNVSWLFYQCVSELLNLTKAEKQKLAWAFAYGQGKDDAKTHALLERMRSA